MKKPRLAAIDIGTNSIRCIVVEVDAKRTFRILDDERVPVRLGEGLHASGEIAAAAWQRAIEALGRLKKIIDGFGVEAIEAVATSAVRKAANGAAFIDTVKKEIGLSIQVISGDEEAELAALSALNNFDLEGTRQLLVDIGGGSLELILTIGQHTEEIYSLELGAVYLTETFLAGQDPIPALSCKNLRRHVRKTLKNIFANEPLSVPSIIGSGGTITAIAAMTAASRKEAYDSVHGYEVLRSDIVHLLAMLERKSLKERRAISGLNPERADIIVAGVLVIDELMSFCQANLLRINERGIREGLILRGLHRHRLATAERQTRSWRESVLAFAAACHFDETHCRHVAKLAGEIFKTLAQIYRFGEKEHRILEAAALLHDVGYFINYASHHKHSYHLIRHAGLFGFTPRERELIALVARYHRKSLPKKRHEEFMRLSAPDQQLVMRLGGILRLADGLDRRRTSAVKSIKAVIESSRLRLELHGNGDLSVEIYGAEVKSDLLQKAFKLRVELTQP
ncbi:MAG TPA: Ppx/GppA phosphatase family protein [Geobacteraceae bacterium]